MTYRGKQFSPYKYRYIFDKTYMILLLCSLVSQMFILLGSLKRTFIKQGQTTER